MASRHPSTRQPEDVARTFFAVGQEIYDSMHERFAVVCAKSEARYEEQKLRAEEDRDAPTVVGPTRWMRVRSP